MPIEYASGFPGNRNDFEPLFGAFNCIYNIIYDTGTRMILDEGTFANFKYLPELGYYRPA